MKEEILKILGTQHTIKKHDLIDRMRKQGINIGNERRVREAIEEMIIKDGILIESSCHGYSLIRDQQQLFRARKYLKEKAISISVRYNILTKNWNKQTKNYNYGGKLNQMRLFY